jgi:hypothetical protein
MRSDPYFWGNAMGFLTPGVRVMAVVIVTGASRWTSLRETTVLVSLANSCSAQGHWPGSYLVLTWNI